MLVVQSAHETGLWESGSCLADWGNVVLQPAQLPLFHKNRNTLSFSIEISGRRLLRCALSARLPERRFGFFWRKATKHNRVRWIRYC